MQACPIIIAPDQLPQPGRTSRFQSWVLATAVPIAGEAVPWNISRSWLIFESRSILNTLTGYSGPILLQNVLCPPLWGLERHERTYSIAMILRHLVSTLEIYNDVIIDLSYRRTPQPTVTLDLLPLPNNGGGDVLGFFSRTVSDFLQRQHEELADMQQNKTYKHPLYGPLNTRQWYYAAALHLSAHRRQLDYLSQVLTQPYDA